MWSNERTRADITVFAKQDDSMAEMSGEVCFKILDILPSEGCGVVIPFFFVETSRICDVTHAHELGIANVFLNIIGAAIDVMTTVPAVVSCAFFNCSHIYRSVGSEMLKQSLTSAIS